MAQLITARMPPNPSGPSVARGWPPGDTGPDDNLSPRVVVLPQTLQSTEVLAAKRKVGTLQEELSEAQDRVKSLERECAVLNGAVEVCLPPCYLSRAVSLIAAPALICSAPCHVQTVALDQCSASLR